MSLTRFYISTDAYVFCKFPKTSPKLLETTKTNTQQVQNKKAPEKLQMYLNIVPRNSQQFGKKRNGPESDSEAL